ncbi:hypothetical protein Tco_0770819 [Tanacetum coccineum]|uniref:Uncharacterized protein n=1 Tax=Tanacetum coccineum TaxID=301880 RepID=A0ABQ4ZDA4_9ASTR
MISSLKFRIVLVKDKQGLIANNVVQRCGLRLDGVRQVDWRIGVGVSRGDVERRYGAMVHLQMGGRCEPISRLLLPTLMYKRTSADSFENCYVSGLRVLGEVELEHEAH